MNIRSSTVAIALCVAAVGVFHVVKFTRQANHAPLARTEVVEALAANDLTMMLQPPPQGVLPCGNASALDTQTLAESVRQIRFSYRPEAERFYNRGNLAQIEMRPGSSININNQLFSLLTIQFERLERAKQNYLSLIHTQRDGQRLTIYVPLQFAATGNSVIDALWRYLPSQPGEHNSLDDMHVDINELLPHDRTYIRAITTDQCGKPALWLALQSPISISEAQASRLNEVLTMK